MLDLTKGFSLIPFTSYLTDVSIVENIITFQGSYSFLKEDPNHGSRRRAYSALSYSNGKIHSFNPPCYKQSSDFNMEEGGKERNFSQIIDRENYFSNGLIKTLVDYDTNLALQSEKLNTRDFIIGLHQIRYLSIGESPSYSSPLGNHKDNEQLVFVHFINMTSNATGGDNLISYEHNKVSNVLQLNNPLDTLVLTHDCYHAVTPIGSLNNSIAYRDVLLVTYEDSQIYFDRLNERDET